MPDKQWVENFVDELTRANEIVDVEIWSDEHRIIVQGKHPESGERLVYDMPIVGAQHRQFSRSRSASRAA